MQQVRQQQCQLVQVSVGQQDVVWVLVFKDQRPVLVDQDLQVLARQDFLLRGSQLEDHLGFLEEAVDHVS